MKITFEAPVMMPTISESLSILTNGAKVCIDDIRHNETNQTVELLMQRKELIEFKKSFLKMAQPVYTEEMIDAVLIIRQVVDIKMKVDDRLRTKCNSCFTVLFGLNINGQNLYLGSVEETQGQTLCEVFITVKGIDIELTDNVKK